MEAFWSRGRQCIKMAGAQRRDVGSTYIEFNKRQRATSQRRDVSTSRCLNVSASYVSQSLKAKGDQNSKGVRRSRTYELGHGDHDRTLTLVKSHHFCIFFFLDRKTDVL